MSHDAARASHQLVDEAIAYIFEHGTGPDGQKVTPTCGKNCPACCYEPVYAERTEAALIAARLLTMDPDVRQRVLQRARAWVQAFEPSALRMQEQPDVLEYRQLRLACPLLEDGECLVYEDRPNGCRAHVALGPRERCEDHSKRRDQMFMMNNEFMAGAMMKLAAGVAVDGHAELLMEHLGLLLAEALLGIKVKSETRTLLQLDFEDDSLTEKPIGAILDTEQEEQDAP
jgi:Fe-S-cluster containining protein